MKLVIEGPSSVCLLSEFDSAKQVTMVTQDGPIHLRLRDLTTATGHALRRGLPYDTDDDPAGVWVFNGEICGGAEDGREVSGIATFASDGSLMNALIL